MTVDERIAQGRLFFSQGAFDKPEEGDLLFQICGIGNNPDGISQPFERIKYYEHLLLQLQKDDSVKFKKIHKGQAYYIMAWICFDMEDFEKSHFYLDCAVSEDIRKTALRNGESTGVIEASLDAMSERYFSEWSGNPSAQYFSLKADPQFVGSKIVLSICKLLEEYFAEYNTITSESIDLKWWHDSFIANRMHSIKARAVISAFYSFLLESRKVATLISVRSTSGGTLEPILTHLFKGALVFESMLKLFYTEATIGGIFRNTSFIQKHAPAASQSLCTSSTSLKEIVQNAKDWKVATVYSTVARLRNTTGHNLAWDDAFGSIDDFNILVKNIIFSIFFVLLNEAPRSTP